MIKKFLLLSMALAALASPLRAAIEDYPFDTAEQEQRFKKLTYEMRCPKCLNANLAGSDAPIAAELRDQIHDQILAGQSDAEIIDFMTTRYGDFILYRPPLNPGTVLLWFGPALLLLAGFIFARRTMKASQREASDAGLSDEERRKLRHILSSPTDR